MATVAFSEIRSRQDGLPLSVMTVAPDGARPLAVLQMAHGMAEHKERYIPLCSFLADRGILCVMNDHRGHGKSVLSAEDLGYFGKNGARALVEDLHQITLTLRAERPGIPLYLYGHSMGSLAVRTYLGLHEGDIDGLVVCGSPGKNPAAGAGLAMIAVLRAFRGERFRSAFLEQMVGGSYSARFPQEGSPFAWLSTVREEVAAYEADPLCGFRFTLNGYEALLRLMQGAYAPRRAAKPDLPVHFLSGSDDPCMPDRMGFDDAVKALRDAGYRNVTAKLYEGMRHEVHNEADRETVYADLAALLTGWAAAGRDGAR